MRCKITLFTLSMLLAGNTLTAQELDGQETDKQETDKQGPSVPFLENGTVFYSTKGETASLELPGSAQSILVSGDRLYVAIGNQGVHVYRIEEDGGLTLDESIPTPQGAATGFLVSGNEIWVELRATSAIPLGAARSSMPETEPETARTPTAPAVMVAATPPEKEAPPETTKFGDAPIEIAATFPGEVKLNLGASRGVAIKDQFEISREITVKKKGLDDFTARQEVALVEVVAINEDYCIARLSRGDRIHKGDIVKPRLENKRIRNVFPKKQENIGEVSLTLRPLLNVTGSNGFGGLVDATGSWVGRHYFVNLRMQPLAFGWTNEGNILSSSVLAEGGYDGQAFAVGLGAGLALVNGDMDGMLGNEKYSDDASEADQTLGFGSRAAFALSQVVRLGARDGLNFVVYNNFIYYNDSSASSNNTDDSGFIYGGTTGKMSIPLNTRVDIFINGGGGRMGYGFGELGIFAWVIGNGGPGSLGISGAAGGAGIWTNEVTLDETEWGTYTETQTTLVAGPMVSLGVTYRFGPSL